MSAGRFNTWQRVRDEVLRRIRVRVWRPDDLLPTEQALADEFGCARTTVNRALRALADAGYLDRRRKVGTRVAVHPVRSAVLKVPIIRQEIEAQGLDFGYSRLSREIEKPSPEILGKLGLRRDCYALRIKALYLADREPYVFEDRWVNTKIVPAALEEEFVDISTNEWLVANAPFTGGDFSFTAAKATTHDADILGCSEGDALFVTERTTRSERDMITTVRLVFGPGYKMVTQV